jgi:hypothetical protein
MKSAIRTQGALVNRIISLYDRSVPLTTTAIYAQDTQARYAITRRNTNGRKLFDTFRDTLFAVASRLDELKRVEDARKIREDATNRCVSPRFESDSERSKKAQRLLSKLNRMYYESKDISYQNMRRTQSKFVAQLIRAVGSYHKCVDEIGLSSIDVNKCLTLPIEAHVCILYDLHLQNMPLDATSCSINAPSSTNAIRKKWRSHYPALSKIESMLTKDGKPQDAIAFNPQQYLSNPWKLRSQERAQRRQKSVATMRLYHDKEVYSAAQIPSSVRSKSVQLTGRQVYHALKQTKSWFLPSDVAKELNVSSGFIRNTFYDNYSRYIIRFEREYRATHLISQYALRAYKSKQ